ncbi:MBL fold metallo-hydrolase [Nonlabens sp.]|uniref:MBL fold metallo-hydrolase n=1 Tax=Nonlabens sp. TaxID=1888209 RepID=UPI0025F71E29|nr:MBL fold metallo-hydrolase [Nonlabens sp.]
MKKLLFALPLVIGCICAAQNKFDELEVITHEVTQNVYMLEGAGGNILIQVGESEVVMIDSQYAALSDQLKKEIARITDKPLKYLINTHHHGDHTGGNENFNTKEISIIAHSNVRNRLIESEKNENFLPEKVLEEEFIVSLIDEDDLIIHVHNAHTDGDSFVYLTQNNVVHMGDVFFNARYPFIDLDSGGSISGYITAQKKVLNTINEETKIVPGHGALASYKDLADYIPMLVDLKTQIQKEIRDGKTREQVEKNNSITKKYDAKGFGDGYVSSEKIRTVIYDSLILETTHK